MNPFYRLLFQFEVLFIRIHVVDEIELLFGKILKIIYKTILFENSLG